MNLPGRLRFGLVVFTTFVAVGHDFVPAQAQTIVQWNFESSRPFGGSGGSHWFTNVAAEVGTGTAALFHLTTGFGVLSPAGNGSAHSMYTSNWNVGDFFQFSLNTLGLSNISVSYDIASGSTGPGKVALEYSTDGANFTVFGGTNSIVGAAGPFSPWNSITYDPAYTMAFDLSSVSGLNNRATVVFRLLDPSTTSANGGTVNGGAPELVDNFTVSVIPEPSNLCLIGVCVLFARAFMRSRAPLNRR